MFESFFSDAVFVAVLTLAFMAAVFVCCVVKLGFGRLSFDRIRPSRIREALTLSQKEKIQGLGHSDDDAINIFSCWSHIWEWVKCFCGIVWLAKRNIFGVRE